MKRLEQRLKTDALAGKRILITGCGYSPIQHTFYDITTGEPSHDSIDIDGQEVKANIGTAVAGILALNGATVHIVSRSNDKLKNIKKYLDDLLGNTEQVEYSAVNLLDEKQVSSLIESLSLDKPIYWVQSIGLGAGAYKVKDNNPYLHVEDIPLELLVMESKIVLEGTHLLMQKLIPIFKKQNRETKLAIISSMSAIRGYNRGATHCAAKGAIGRYTNSAMLDLWKERIFVTDVRPGAVDTGMYDNEEVQKAVIEVAKEYGNCWNTPEEIRLAPPTTVGEAIQFIFTAPAHIPSINIVAKGQFPNEGS